MFHVKIVPDMEKFLNVVECSKGDVFLHFPGEGKLNLKERLDTRQISRMMRARKEGFHVSLSDGADFPAFLRYMLDSATH